MKAWGFVLISILLLDALAGCGEESAGPGAAHRADGGAETDSGTGGDGGSITPTLVDGSILIEAESALNGTATAFVTPGTSEHAWQKTGDEWERAAVKCLPDVGAKWPKANLGGPGLNYRIPFAKAGDYSVWVLSRAPGVNKELTNGASSIHVALDGAYPFTPAPLPTNSLEKTAAGAVVVDDPLTWFNYSFEWSRVGVLKGITKGDHTLNIQPGEDGVEIDAIYLTPTGEWPRLGPDDGYDLWLRYRQISNNTALARARQLASRVVVQGKDATSTVTREELVNGLGKLLGSPITEDPQVITDGTVVVGSPDTSDLIAGLGWGAELSVLGEEGFVIRAANVKGKSCLVVAGSTAKGALYGAFRLLAKLDLHEDLSSVDTSEKPKNALRVLQHWDRWDRKIGENFAGKSIFDMKAIAAGVVSPRYKDYARALASLGINVVTINSVNAEDIYIDSPSLPAVARLAEALRAYGIRVSLAVGFDAPQSLGGLGGYEPDHAGVPEWWTQKVAEIYAQVPDLAGLVVKASSEGQPGPGHAAQGANMIADAVRPFGGVVWWRAFVYGNDIDADADRARQAYSFFKPYDGDFAPEVILQVKNGPLDFQTREPVSPLFGQMPSTQLGLELQIRQEYTGGVTHAVFLVPAWKEALDFDTQALPQGSRVRDLLADSPSGRSSYAGVANVGANFNWTGHPLAQANWYGFGRLAWDPSLSAEQIADEWTRRTLGHAPKVVATVTSLLLASYRTYEDYTLGMAPGTIVDRAYQFYPWLFQRQGCEATWNPTSMTWSCPKADAASGLSPGDVRNQVKASATHVGYNRSPKGTNYAAQYSKAVGDMYGNLATCPEPLLLWFHRVPYTHVLKNGSTLIQHIYDSHFDAADRTTAARTAWTELEGEIPEIIWNDVRLRMQQQVYQARKWRDHVNNYFFELSQIPDAHPEKHDNKSVDAPFTRQEPPY
jgi:alpha-glucuronidase